MKSSVLIILGIVIGFVLLIALIALILGIKYSNNFKRLEIKTNEAFSGVDVALQKRYSVLTKSFNVASQYAKFEKETILRAIQLRSGAKTIDEMNNANREMDNATRYFFALAENYPQLHASAQFVELQRQISDTEEHLQAARRSYNASVRDYNTAISVFPASMFAGGRLPKRFFEAENRNDVQFPNFS